MNRVKNQKKIWIGIFIFLLAVVIGESIWTYIILRDSTIALVDGEKITESEFNTELKRSYGKEVLNEIINKKVIKMTADKYGIKASQEAIDEEYTQLKEGYQTEEEFNLFLREQMGLTKEQLLEHIEYYLLWEEIAIKDIEISDKQVEQYYKENPDLFIEPEKLHIEQIIVSTEEEAKQVLSEIKNGSDFNTLAKEKSIDIFTSSNGGDLGFVSVNDPSLDPAILVTATSLEINEVAMTETEEGFGVIRLKERKEEKQYAFEEVKDDIKRELALNQVSSLPEVLEQLKLDLNVKILDPDIRE